MGLRYTFYDEEHRKIGVVDKTTDKHEIERIKLIYGLDEVKTKE